MDVKYREKKKKCQKTLFGSIDSERVTRAIILQYSLYLIYYYFTNAPLHHTLFICYKVLYTGEFDSALTIIIIVDYFIFYTLA